MRLNVAFFELLLERLLEFILMFLTDLSQSDFVGSMDQESSQELRTWLSEHFLRHNL